MISLLLFHPTITTTTTAEEAIKSNQAEILVVFVVQAQRLEIVVQLPSRFLELHCRVLVIKLDFLLVLLLDFLNKQHKQ